MIKNKPIISASLVKDEFFKSNQPNNKLKDFIFEKSQKINDIVQNVSISLQKHKKLDIFSNSDLNACNFSLTEIHNKNKELLESIQTDNETEILMKIQDIFNKTTTVVSSFGTNKLDDVLYLSFGKNFEIELGENATQTDFFLSKLKIIKKHSSFINYKLLKSKWEFNNKTIGCCDKLGENTIIPEFCNQLELLEPNTLSRSIDYSINGSRLIIQNKKEEKTIILYALLDDIDPELLNQELFIKFQKTIYESIKLDYTDSIDIILFDRLLKSLTLKDYLIYSANDIYKKYITLIKDVEYVKLNKLEIVIKKFMEMDILNQRRFLIHLLIYCKESDIHYIAYILYDTLTPNKSNNSEINIDSDRQNIIYNSLPWNVKLYFKDAMKCTMNYSSDNLKYDTGRISLEQQIILMKTSDAIKQKAMIKLKEVKCKPEDQGSKAKQYLEGLIKIPFDIYKKEPVLCKMSDLNNMFICLGKITENFYENFPIKKKYTLFEIKNKIENMKKSIFTKANQLCINAINKMKISKLRGILKELDIKEPKPFNKDVVITSLNNNTAILKKLNLKMDDFILIEKIEEKIGSLQADIVDIKTSLESSIYAHNGAKTQILKIISQWINGDQKGYCFGFEGAPGVGKTSLAKKGISNCLKDENGISRPFAFIALGGSSNGPTLEGHNYTYVNSTWGKIVDTLMDVKCMNPIIYIDELDKVSKTEQGKEIIGILMHLIDSTQNDEFQDKYFNGIPIDLSKVLFIFSYNDPDQIDPILLDRIHRIKFDNLSAKDKHVICKKFIIPEINEKMGFENTVEMEDETLDHIIENYTLEIGIRKLKEIIFDLYGEINIELLSNPTEILEATIPIVIKKEDLGKKYLKKYIKINEKMIHDKPEIGIINGLWANSQGKGGIISIECSFFPTPTFLELKLTGMQGDVMKESMNVAKTLAWNLTCQTIQKNWIRSFEETCNKGIHVHCPEGAVSKDGPSAGAAITIAMYSLLNGLKIKNAYAITGEITLKGDITAIGGLELKILGGIRAGVKTFLYPESNQHDCDECNKKYFEFFREKNVKFISVKKIQDALSIIYE